MSWQHAPDNDTMLVTGPLGQGLAELVREGDAARLTLSDHRQFDADTLDALAERVFGTRLPLSHIAHWILATDGVEASSATNPGSERPRQLIAQGWTIDLREWESSAADALPTLVELHRDDLDVRLRVISWEGVR